MGFLKRIKFPNVNAVLFKDMQQKTKRSQLVIELFLVNLLLSLVAIIILLSMAISGMSFEPIDYSILPTFFVVMGFLEFGFIILVAPSLTAGSITMEREKQTFDVLLSTALSTRQIIWGKFWAAILQVVLLVLSGFPIFAIVFMYGGISFLQALGVLVTLLLIMIYASSIGMFFSSSAKKSIVATVLTYVFIIVALFGTMSMVGTVKAIVALINEAAFEATGSRTGLTGDFSIILLYLNPLCTIFDAISNLFGLSIFGSSLGMAGIISGITNYSRSNILFTLWTPISLAIQMLISWGLLELSARNIDPLRKKANKHARKQRKQKNT